MDLHFKRMKGFTLIELVVAMLIIGILAAVAIPSYNSYTRKARRVEAKTALLDLASLEERYFSVNNGYTNSQSLLGYSGTAGALFNVGSGYYQVQITGVAAPTLTTVATYTLTATPTPGTDQVNDTTCTSFTITNQGVQTATPTANTTTCWH
jgi:type IV pilus assembly protein PilE